jgi:hypothetical protein
MNQLGGAAGAKLRADGRRPDEAVVMPLREQRLSGELYERDPKVEALNRRTGGPAA